jgi:hypothetical protein
LNSFRAIAPACTTHTDSVACPTSGPSHPTDDAGPHKPCVAYRGHNNPATLHPRPDGGSSYLAHLCIDNTQRAVVFEPPCCTVLLNHKVHGEATWAIIDVRADEPGQYPAYRASPSRIRMQAPHRDAERCRECAWQRPVCLRCAASSWTTRTPESQRQRLVLVPSHPVRYLQMSPAH